MRGILEALEVWEELLANKLHKVVTTHGANGIEYHLTRLQDPASLGVAH